jgi:hypothetical protein
VKFEELRSREGYDPQKESPKFGPLWRGGEWHLSDITKCMTTAAFLLLDHAATNRGQWLQRFYAIGKDAVRPRRPGELYGFLIEASNEESKSLISILERGGVEVTVPKDTTNSKVGVPQFSDTTRLVRLDQPYGAFAKTLLEVQRYPNLRDATGHPIAPYDVTAHTLPLLMGVTVRAVKAPFRYSRDRFQSTEKTVNMPGGIHQNLPAIYHSAVPSQDEGWTRWILDSRKMSYGVLGDKELRAGITVFKPSAGVTIKYYTILIPDQPARTLLEGYRPESMPRELTGGLGPEGVKALRYFVETGGTLVFLNRASNFAIEQFKLPLRNVVGGLPRTEFYVPGSILGIKLDDSPLTKGMPDETIAWAEDSPVFEVTNDPDSSVPAANVHVVASYPADKDPLLSGWLLGGDLIKGKAALVEVKMGKGRIILFGFRPQYRAQSLVTYPLFFNALAPQ